MQHECDAWRNGVEEEESGHEAFDRLGGPARFAAATIRADTVSIAFRRWP